MDYGNASDEQLMHWIARADEDALGALYDRYCRLITSVAFGVLGDRGLAEEVTVDVFTSAWAHASGYDVTMSRVRTWLTRVARNRAIDVMRREQVRPMRHSLSWAEIGPEPTAGQPGPEHRLQLALRQQRVRQALASLPAAQRQALALAFFQGLTHREIASTLDEPLGTIKTRIRDGMKKLRVLLQDERYEH